MPDLNPDLTEVDLKHGSLRLSVCPALGGAITRLSFGGVDLLRPWDGSESVRRTGCFVLAPFSNRVGEGAFEHDGQHYPLRRLSAEHPLPIHGVAWKRAWSITERNPARLCLRFAHQPEGDSVLDWPFAFEVEHSITLDDDGVALQLTLRNNDSRSMPAGLGWHPYFLRREACRLRFEAQGVWHNDAHDLPAKQTSIPAEWDFSTERPLQQPDLDNCFAGRTEPITIRWPNEGVELTMHPSETLDHLVVFTPAAEMGFFAVEPVSHANNALCMDDPAAHGVHTLAPGETMQVDCSFKIVRT